MHAAPEWPIGNTFVEGTAAWTVSTSAAAEITAPSTVMRFRIHDIVRAGHRSRMRRATQLRYGSRPIFGPSVYISYGKSVRIS